MTHPDPEGAPGSLCLDPTLSLAQARPLFEQIMARRGEPLTLDASAVTHLGAQCAQILVAARTAWAAQDCPFTVVTPSDPFTDGVRLLGLADHLQG